MSEQAILTWPKFFIILILGGIAGFECHGVVRNHAPYHLTVDMR